MSNVLALEILKRFGQNAKLKKINKNMGNSS